ESHDATCKQLEEVFTPLNERVEQLSVMLNLISEQQLLSDRAKSVAFREKDREALRRAIQEDIGRQDFEAAITLADEMERVFGYRGEAERLRQQISERKNENVRRAVSESTG